MLERPLVEKAKQRQEYPLEETVEEDNEAMLQRRISSLCPLEEVGEHKDNKESDQDAKTVALIKMIEKLMAAKQHAKAEERCICYVIPCPRGCLDMTNKK